MTTAREIVSTSLLRLGVVAQGEVPTAQEASDGLALLNSMLDSWSLENMLILADTITVVPLTAGDETYTIGSGGDIDVAWPLQIEQAQLRITQFTPVLDLPLQILNAQEYGLIRIKQLDSTYPQAIFLHTTFPLGTLHVWPRPSQANSLVLWHKGLVASFATLDTDVTLPRGYRLALEWNLAEYAGPEYGITVSRGKDIERFARQTKAILKRANTKKMLGFVDVPAGQRRNFGSYNWLHDSYVGGR